MEVVITKDGSATMYSSLYDEHYHSVLDGAYVESMKKHVEPAFEYCLANQPDELTVLDICFGLGYNTLCAINYVKKMNRPVGLKIISPEIDETLVGSLAAFQYPKELSSLEYVIESVAKKSFYTDGSVLVEVVFASARDVVKQLESNSIDIVFQDAFSPKNNKELWTLEYFSDIKKVLKEDGIVTTYTRSTGVRLAMQEAGFLLYEHTDSEIRSGTICLNKKSPMFREVDMSKKLKNAPESRAFRD